MQRPLRTQSLVLGAALLVQYALGMYVNLFVSFPAGANAAQLWEFAWRQWPLAAHLILAILLLIGAIVLCFRAILRYDTQWILVSILGLLGILWAGASGAIFVSTQTDAYSFSMSLGFLVALLAYGWGSFAQQV